MKYKGIILILDNFRSVLKEYSVDIQDVVRSAILDGVDLEKWLTNTSCKSPYKLDQIRLCMKEGYISDTVFNALSGDQLYSFRGLRAANYPVEQIEQQLMAGKLVGEYLDYMLQWLSNGYNIDGVNMSIIPKSMLKIFDTCLSKGFNILPFNNGRVYTAEYINYCFLIMQAGKSYLQFAEHDWDPELMKKVIVPFSRKLSEDRWSALLGLISYNEDVERASAIANLLHAGCNPRNIASWMNVRDLNVIRTAYKDGYSLSDFLNPNMLTEDREALLRSLKAKRGVQISGKITKAIGTGFKN